MGYLWVVHVYLSWNNLIIINRQDFQKRMNYATALMEKGGQELAVWYNNNVIYPDNVRLNCYYYRNYSFWKDIEMIFATVLGIKVKFAGKKV